ncbi:GntR family transcriptional regulator [soil metagenome]
MVRASSEAMVTRRPDPFLMALESLKARVESGAFAPGAAIVIIDEAKRLGLSPTPIRAALAWLSGYGLIERAPMGGYLMRRLDPARVRDEMSFRLLCLRIGLNGAGQVHGLGPKSATGGSPQRVLHDQMVRAVRGTGNGALVEAYERVSSLLAQLAVAEQRLFQDLEAEAQAIVTLFEAPAGSGLPEALAAYHQRRIDAAALLVVEAEAGRSASGG